MGGITYLEYVLCMFGLHLVMPLTVKDLLPAWYGREPGKDFRKLWNFFSSLVCIFRVIRLTDKKNTR